MLSASPHAGWLGTLQGGRPAPTPQPEAPATRLPSLSSLQRCRRGPRSPGGAPTESRMDAGRAAGVVRVLLTCGKSPPVHASPKRGACPGEHWGCRHPRRHGGCLLEPPTNCMTGSPKALPGGPSPVRTGELGAALQGACTSGRRKPQALGHAQSRALPRLWAQSFDS